MPRPDPAARHALSPYHAPPGAVPFADFLHANKRLADEARFGPRPFELPGVRTPEPRGPRAPQRPRPDVARLGDVTPAEPRPIVPAPPTCPPVQAARRQTGLGTIIDVTI